MLGNLRTSPSWGPPARVMLIPVGLSKLALKSSVTPTNGSARQRRRCSTLVGSVDLPSKHVEHQEMLDRVDQEAVGGGRCYS